jgi:hypothetical protein
MVGKPGTKCTICTHRERAAIDLAIVRGISADAIVKRYGLGSTDAVRKCILTPHHGGDAMRKRITAIIVTAGLAVMVIAAPKPAEARCIGCWVGAGIAAGVVAGALASRSYGYGYPAYSYGYAYPAYGYAQPYGYYGGYYAPRRYYARRYYRY